MKKSFITLFGSTLTVALLGYSCEKVEYVEEKKTTVDNPQLSLSEEHMTLKRSTRDTSFQVTSNTSWQTQVIEGSEWCSANPPSNQGDSRILVRIKANPEIRSREAVIRIFVDKDHAETITLEQPGAPLVPFNTLALGIAPKDTDLPIAGLGEWTAEVTTKDGGNWCTLSQYSGTDVTTIQIIAEINDSGSERYATVTVTCGEVEETVEITQSDYMATPTVMFDDGNTFKLSWDEVAGAGGYKVNISDGNGSPVGEASLAPTVLEYALKNETGNALGTYMGTIKIKVTATTKDPDVFRESTEISGHSHYGGGSGDGESEDGAFLVSCARHLNNVRMNPDKYFKQTADIDLAAYDDDKNAENGNLNPINNFSGIYSGNNGGTAARIKNLKISSSSTQIALFGSIGGSSAGSSSRIEYLVLENPEIKCTAASGVVVTAALVAQAGKFTEISYCGLSGGTVTASGNQVGGLIANSGASSPTDLIISHCYNDGCTITGGNNVAGILANNGANIEYCWNSGTINGAAYAGGIVGSHNKGTISYSYNTGDVKTNGTGNDCPAGGITGRELAGDGASIHYCFNTGTITNIGGKGAVGGITGKTSNNASLISNCYNTGTITGTSTQGTGGIAGILAAGTVTDRLTNCYNTANVTAPGNAGGIAGSIDNTSTAAISGSYFLKAAGINETLNGVGAGNSGGVAGKTNAEMTSQNTFNNWDFSGEWEISGSYPYPQLKKLHHRQ